MTVSRLHDYMTEKVAPESVMPQNITAVLMDEDASIPELDAFTFLNRVRALGIGSADFLYLLKGCDAPEEAIEKIEKNPAMNLQSLIVTMEEAGITPKDYTRMLYTARQIWERTLTVRLEQLEAEGGNDDDNFTDEYQPQYEDDSDGEYDGVYQEDDEEYQPVTAKQKRYSHTCDDDEEYQPATAKQKRYSHTYDDEESDEYEVSEQYSGCYEENEPHHKGKIVAAAAGSAVLIGLSAVLHFGNILPAAQELPTAVYATDSTQIFSAIYNAYSAGISGGENVILPDKGRDEAFGSMLVSTEGGFGVYNVGDSAFDVYPELITVYTEKNSALSTLCTISPPEGAEFVEIVCEKDMLAAVFADSDSVGFAAYDEDGNVLYTTHQVGKLTDICTSRAGTISLGTVYTPKFTESFTSDRTDKYLPIISAAGEASTVPATEIAMTEGSVGCSYAVYGEYSLADGSLADRAAALGDPVYSDADRFMAVMKSAGGYEVIVEGMEETPQLVQLPSLIACDMGDTVMVQLSEDNEPYDSTLDIKREWNIIATAQKEADGSTTVYLRGFDFEPVAAITNIPTEVTSVKMERGILYICDKNGAAMVLNIANPSTPQVLQLTQYNGIIRGNHALCSELSGNIVRFTLYKRDDDGTVTEACSTAKSVNAAPDTVPEIGGVSTFFIGDETRCAAAFSYFDGVSVISEYALFGRANTSYTLFDDKNGFTAGVGLADRLYLIYGNNSITA